MLAQRLAYNLFVTTFFLSSKICAVSKNGYLRVFRMFSHDRKNRTFVINLKNANLKSGIQDLLLHLQ
jgi:hypothetical protein